MVKKLTGGLSGLAKQRKVTVVDGDGRFTALNQLEVEADGGKKTVSFEQAIIAAGSEPVTLPFIPHDDPRVIDSTGALALDGVPKRLLVIGGGIIGLEMATVYHRSGAKVTIVELMDQIIPGADKDIVTPLHEADRQALRGDPPEGQGHQGRGEAGRAHRDLRGRQRAGDATSSTRSWSRSAASRTAS